MGTGPRGPIPGFTRYDAPAEFERWHAMALASIVPPGEEYVLGIDGADRWLFRRWGTKLVLTDARVVAFAADPADPMKRSHWFPDISGVNYETGRVIDELRLVGDGLYEVYAVPKGLGREFAEALERALTGDDTVPACETTSAGRYGAGE